MKKITWSQGEKYLLGGRYLEFRRVLNHPERGLLVQVEDPTNGEILALDVGQMRDAWESGSLRLGDAVRVRERRQTANKAQYPIAKFCAEQSLADLAGTKMLWLLGAQKIIRSLQRLGITCGQTEAIRRELPGILVEVRQEYPEYQRNPGISTVQRWWRQLILNDGDWRAVLPKWEERRGQNFEPSEASDANELILHETIEALYLEGSDAEETYNEYVLNVGVANMLRLPNRQLKPLSKRTMLRRIDELPKFDVLAARKGDEYARRHFRQCKSAPEARSPLQRVTMDNALIKVFLLDDTTYMPLGMPWVTAAKDDNTGMPLGIHVSFAHPTQSSVMSCLKQCMLPKDNILKRFPSINGTWDAYGIPKCLLADNGSDYLANALKAALAELDIDGVHHRARQPWHKGSIERYMRKIQKELAAKIPGAVVVEIVKATGIDPSKVAVMTLTDFLEALYGWVIEDLQIRINRRKGDSPKNLWAQRIKLAPPTLPTSAEQYEVLMGLTKFLKVGNEGIVFEDIRYGGQDLENLYRRKGAIKVRVQFDPNDLGKASVFDEEAQAYFSVMALDPEYAGGLTYSMHRILRKRVLEAMGKTDIRINLAIAARNLRERIRLASSRKDLPKEARLAVANSAHILSEEAIGEKVETVPMSTPPKKKAPRMRTETISTPTSDAPDFEILEL